LVLGVEILVGLRDVKPFDPVLADNYVPDVLGSMNGRTFLLFFIPFTFMVEVHEHIHLIRSK
jgi:hypothetical protein